MATCFGYSMRAMVHKREVIRNMTKAILAEKGNSNTQNHILGMYVGTKYVGVSYCDPATKGVKPMGPALPRKEKDVTSISELIKNIIERYGIGMIVVARPWSIEEEEVPNIFEIVQQKVGKHEVTGLIMTGSEEDTKNDFDGEAAKVDSFMLDLSKTGVLNQVYCFYFSVKLMVNPSSVRKVLQELRSKGDERFVYGDEKELEEEIYISQAAQFMLMHFMQNDFEPWLAESQGRTSVRKQCSVAIRVDDGDDHVFMLV